MTQIFLGDLYVKFVLKKKYRVYACLMLPRSNIKFGISAYVACASLAQDGSAQRTHGRCSTQTTHICFFLCAINIDEMNS